jgi:hypothetical protein
MHAIEITNDLMMVLDEDGNGYDCYEMTSLAEAQSQLEKWKDEYSFNYDEAQVAVAEFFVAQ